MATQASDSLQTPQLDRLSLLPNELLDEIFEHAYSEECPAPPLSKRLYPFFERHFHRNVCLASLRQLDSFSATIEANYSKGRLVHNLAVLRPPGEDSSIVLDPLLLRLPNLLALSLPIGRSAISPIKAATMSHLSRLTQVSARVQDSELRRIALSDFAPLSALPSLSELNVKHWPEFFGGDRPTAADSRFLSVTTLRVKGAGADLPAVNELAKLCPALLHLHLESVWEDVVSFSSLLPLLPTTLRTLQLSARHCNPGAIASLLSRFSNLRSLDLGAECYPISIHLILSRLPNLVYVRLGEGGIDTAGFGSLVSGSTRHPCLENVVLDYDPGVQGSRTPLEDDLSNVTGDLRSVHMEGWRLARLVERDDGRRDVIEHKRLFELAHAQGIEMGGSILEAFETVENYRIEANNRSVVYAAQTGDLRWLERARIEAEVDGVILPPLDLDSLDPNNLEIVETELPEKNWFMLSLRNKEVKAEAGTENEKECRTMSEND